MEEQLIAEVSRFPILFDTSHERYKCFRQKDAVWKEITSKLYNSTDPAIIKKVKNKWKNLRSNFLKYQRKVFLSNTKPWKLEAHMRFLLPHLNPKSLPNRNMKYEKLPFVNLETNSKGEEWESSIKSGDESENSHYSAESLVTEHSEAGMEDSLKIQERCLTESCIESVKHFLDVSDDTDEACVQPLPMHLDDVDSFFLGLAQTVKKLKHANQVHVKNVISSVIFDTAFLEA